MAGKVAPLTIILATVIPVVFVVSLVIFLWRCTRKRSSSGLFNRGITPIADEEIESWRNDRSDEKEPIPEPEPAKTKPQRQPSTKSHHQHHQQNSSVSSIQKPPSVIVYQNPAQYQPRASGEQSPRSAGPSYKRSMDNPQTPILARAPNARPGLTDEAVQGDDAFIPQIKRQPSRLTKSHSRHRSAYGAVGAGRDRWNGPGPDGLSRKSADNIPRRGSAARGHDRLYSATENPPRMSLDDSSPAGLSPRPLLHRSEIGRAIG